jgi:hypothetical protein
MTHAAADEVSIQGHSVQSEHLGSNLWSFHREEIQDLTWVKPGITLGQPGQTQDFLLNKMFMNGSPFNEYFIEYEANCKHFSQNVPTECCIQDQV